MIPALRTPVPSQAQRLAPWLVLSLGTVAWGGAGVRGEGAPDDFARDVRPLLERTCSECHGGERPRAGLDLSPAALTDAGDLEPEDWELVRDLVTYEEMPPPGHARPTAAERAALLGWLDGRLGRPDDRGPDPGPAPLRRLNNRELARALEHVLGVPMDVEAYLGPDPVGHGFDTVGDVLSLPAERVERMLTLAEGAAGMVFPVDDARLTREQHFGPEAFEARGHSGGRANLTTNGDATVRAWVPRRGRYAFVASLSASRAGDELARATMVVDGEVVGDEREVAAGLSEPEEQRWEFDLTGGSQRLAVRFLNDFWNPDELDASKRDRNLYVHGGRLEGPLDEAGVGPLELELAAAHGDDPRAMLRDLGRRLWRRPPTEAELDGLLALTAPEDRRTLRLQLGLVGLLASPHFHLRVEGLADGPDTPDVVRLTGPELATRLALFLWSSVPDAALLDAAEAGRLDDDAGLAREVERLLADPRARVLAEAFGLAWLGAPALAQHRPDPARFQVWNHLLAASAVEETRRLCEELLFEDRPLTDLVAADWTWIDRRLALLYGQAPPPWGEWRRVSLEGTPRRGVLGHASLLAVTSNPTRTSIPRRGKWVLEVLLGAPPPDPPPGVDSLDESQLAADLTLRERLEQHRQNPDCVSCHASIDPIGFGLEVFDGVGRVRRAVELEGLDVRGEFPDGRTFEGPVELSALLAEEPRLARQAVERMLVFALGRGLERSDRPEVEALLARLDPERPTLGQVLRAVCHSPLLTHRRARRPAPDGGPTETPPSSLPGTPVSTPPHDQR